MHVLLGMYATLGCGRATEGVSSGSGSGSGCLLSSVPPPVSPLQVVSYQSYVPLRPYLT